MCKHDAKCWVLPLSPSAWAWPQAVRLAGVLPAEPAAPPHAARPSDTSPGVFGTKGAPVSPPQTPRNLAPTPSRCHTKGPRGHPGEEKFRRVYSRVYCLPKAFWPHTKRSADIHSHYISVGSARGFSRRPPPACRSHRASSTAAPEAAPEVPQVTHLRYRFRNSHKLKAFPKSRHLVLPLHFPSALSDRSTRRKGYNYFGDERKSMEQGALQNIFSPTHFNPFMAFTIKLY